MPSNFDNNNNKLSTTYNIQNTQHFVAMDVLGVNQVKSKRQAKRSKKGIKVVYIASPMKVETSASKFRDLVQELTGQDSDTARYMEVNGGDHQGSFTFSDQQLGVDINGGVSNKLPLSNSCGEFLPYSESFFKPFNDHIQFDVLGSLGPV